MERISEINDIVLLMDSYSKEAEQLHTTFKLSGVEFIPVIIDNDGFAPDDVISVYDSFLTSEGQNEQGKPRYFNQIEVPEYWEIDANNTSGRVLDLNKEKARIYYAEPKNRRLVKVVEWLDEKGFVRVSDHYNKCGRLYARTSFNSKGERVNKSYFSVEGKEIIVENYITSHVILNYGDVVKIFKNKTEFVKFYLLQNGFENCRLFYNSLSYPFFVSQIMPANRKEDVLIWQEKARNDIPGNMVSILEHRANRTERIMVQIKSAYEKLVELGASKNIVKLFGCVYPYRKENAYSNNALICTNSDQIAHLEEIVKALPNVQFHVAALTEMSSVLMDMDIYSNVTLYPAANIATIDELFMRCDYYFDINRFDEIVDAVRTAYLHNHLLFSFRDTMHNGDYIANDNIFDSDDYERLVQQAKKVIGNRENVNRVLELQKAKAADADASDISKILS